MAVHQIPNNAKTAEMANSRIHIAIADDDVDDQIMFQEALNDVKLFPYSIHNAYNGVQMMDILLRRGVYESEKNHFQI